MGGGAFGVEQAQEALGSCAAQAQDIISNPSKITDTLVQLEKKLEEAPVIGSTVADVPVMISMVKGYVTKEYTDVSPKVIASLVGAFLYLVAKTDIIPDTVPVAGFVDDIAVLGLAISINKPELEAFAAWRDANAPVEQAAEAPEA